MADTKFKKGHQKLPKAGRKKGIPNRFTSLKRSFLDAFEKTGGTEGLIEWIEKSPKNRGEFYKMITKLLPQDIEHSGDINLIVSNKFLPEIKK